MAAAVAPPNGGGQGELGAFAERRRAELYGRERRREADELVASLRQSHVFRSDDHEAPRAAESAADKWKTTTARDFKQEMVPASDISRHALENASQQLDAHFRLGNGSSGANEEDYYCSKTKSDYKMDVATVKPPVAKRDTSNNWSDVDPPQSGSVDPRVSTYADVYKSNENMSLARPHYGKKDTSKLALPLPLDETKVKVSVKLGSEQLKTSSDYQEAFIDPRSAAAADPGTVREAAKQLKAAMEYTSNTFREGDYDGITQPAASTFSVDYGKREPGAEFKLPRFSMASEASSDGTSGGHDVHFSDGSYSGPRLPKLISHSMQTSDALKDGAEGKRYHTRAHFEFGSHEVRKQSVYAKDFPQTSAPVHGGPRGSRPTDSNLFGVRRSVTVAGGGGVSQPLQSSYASDYGGGRRAGPTSGFLQPASADGARVELARNVEKSLTHNVRLHYDADGNKSARQRSLFSESYRKPSASRKRTPAKERRAKFDLLRSDGAMASQPPATKESENKENYRDWRTLVDPETSQSHGGALRMDALKRMKSGRRSHYILGYARAQHSTENREIFQGKQKEDQHTRAAGVTEKDPGIAWNPLRASDNTAEGNLADPRLPSKMESLAAQEVAISRRDAKQFQSTVSVTKSDFVPVAMQPLTAAQVKQHDANVKASRKPQASTHFFHTDTSGGDNYLTTSAASFIKPELMSGKVYL